MEEPVVASKRNKVTVLLDPDEFQQSEAYYAKRGFKKSTLIARWIREHLDNQCFSMQRDLPRPSFANGDGGSSQ